MAVTVSNVRLESSGPLQLFELIKTNAGYFVFSCCLLPTGVRDISMIGVSLAFVNFLFPTLNFAN